jgi:TP901 family phage tail tape measure protein
LRTDAFLAAAMQAANAFQAMGDTMEEKAAATQAAVEASTLAMGAAFVGLGVAIAGAVIKIGSDMEQMMLHLQANTGSTDAQMQEMSTTIMRLGKESGASFESIAGGMQHVRNFGYQAADSTKILTAAMQAAVATGADTNATANLLASTMHQFGIETDQSSQTMNALLVAAQRGNMTLEQFVTQSNRVFSVAANMGVSLKDAAAAMSTLTARGFDAGRAASNLVDIMLKIANPTASARKYIESLGDAGKQLGEDFTATGLKARGLSQVLEDIAQVARDTGQPLDDVMLKLITGIRGGTGAMALAGTGADDYRERLTALQEAIDGKVTPSQTAYNKELGSLATQMGRLKNDGAAAAKSFYDSWEPVLTKLTRLVANLADQWVRTNTTTVPEDLARRGEAIASWMNPRTDLGNRAPWTFPDAAQQAAQRASDAEIERRLGLNPANPIQSLDLSEWARTHSHPAARPGGGAGEFQFDPTGGLTKAQRQYNDMVMAQYRAQEKAQKDAAKAGEQAQREANRAAEEAARTAEKTAETVKAAMDRAYAATHSRYQVERKDADEQYREDIAAARGNARAKQEIMLGYVATIRRIREEQLKEDGDYMKSTFDRLVEDAKKKADLAKETAEKLKRIEEERDRQQKRAEESGNRWVKAIQEEQKKGWDGVAESAKKAVKRLFDDLNTQTDTMLGRIQHQMQGMRSPLDTDTEQREKRVRELEDFKLALQQKLAAVKRYSAEYFIIMQRIKQIDDEIDKAKIKSPWEQMILDMQDFAKKTLVNDLGNAFVNGWKGFFKTLLGQFEQMLAQMAAQALVAGIFNLLGMGGGLGGGFFGGVMGGLFGSGFDSPTNDRAANRWGWDLASHLSAGVDSYNHQRGGMARSLSGAGAGAGGGLQVNVNMTGDHHYASGMDARRVADEIAFHTQARLTVMRKPKA